MPATDCKNCHLFCKDPQNNRQSPQRRRQALEWIKMDKISHLFIIALLFLLCGCTKSDNQYIGTFETVQPKWINSGALKAEKIKEAAKLMNLTLNITSNQLHVKMGDKDYLEMEYFKEGNCLVGKHMWGDQTIYYPIYFSDKDNAYSSTHHFIRLK